MTAQQFIESLQIIGEQYAGSIPKREIFVLAKEFQLAPVIEVIHLLQEKNNDYRLGAVSILDWKARNKKTSLAERKEIYHAYVDHHDCIDDWGLVDRAAPYVVGAYLFDKPREPLYRMAISANPYERRTAIVSTYFFIRKNDIEDTFKIAELLIHDSDQAVQTAVGSWVREAGKRNETKLTDFLDSYAATMQRITLRYAIEKLDSDKRKYYLGIGKNKK